MWAKNAFVQISIAARTLGEVQGKNSAQAVMWVKNAFVQTRMTAQILGEL